MHAGESGNARMRRWWRRTWPHHPEDKPDVLDLPLRLAGDVPWAQRIHLVLLGALGLLGILFVATPWSVAPWDLGLLLVMGGCGLTFTGIAGGVAFAIRRARSVLVTESAIAVSAPGSGPWISDVVAAAKVARVRFVDIDEIILVRRRERVALIGGDLNLDVLVRRLGLRLAGRPTSVEFPGLSFSTGRRGRRRAIAAGEFLARVSAVEFRSEV